MPVYWTLFVLPAVWRYMGGLYPQIGKYGLSVIAVALVLFIGLRDHVGCDWNNYLRSFNEIAQNPFDVSLQAYEPGHVVVNALASNFGLSVHATNFFYGIVFVVGLMAFVRRQPIPWLTLMLGVTYLIIVVAMGYSRQATAIGILFFAFNACADRRVLATIAWVIVASLFHKSALLFVCLVPASREFRLDYLNFATVPIALFGLYLMAGDVDQYREGYIESGMVSEGGPIRLILTALAGVAFFSLWKSFFRYFKDKYLFLLLAVMALLLLPANLIASTAADRTALYLLPFQVAVVSRLPLAFAGYHTRNAVVAGIVAIYAAQQYIWLNYAVNAYCWLPYNNLIFFGLF